MKNLTFKTLLPYLAALAIFISVTLAYFNPLLKGKEISQGDIIHFKGMSKEIVDFREKYHEEPLWTNSMFGGMPAYQISVLYNGNLMRYISKIFMLGLPHPSGYVFLYMLGFFILLLTLRVDTWLAVLGAVGYGFSSFFFIVIVAGHNSEAHAIGYMAPTLAGVILIFRGRLLLGGALTALFLSLELYANHLQITYYLLLMLIILALVEMINAVKEKKIPEYLKSAGVLAVASLLAVGPNITNLLVTADYGKYTTRGKSDLTIRPDGTKNEDKTSGLDKDYATQWSYGKSETMTFLIPNFKGGASDILANNESAMKKADSQSRQYVGNFSQYWGDQSFTSGPVYIGSIILFLAVFGLFIIPGRMKWFLLIATLLSIMLSWGRNFMWLTSLFMDYFPGYNKFRSVTMILVIAELTLPLIGILALDRFAKNRNLLKEKKKIPFVKNPVTILNLFIISFALTGGVALLCYIMPETFNSFENGKDVEEMAARYQPRTEEEQKQIYSVLNSVFPEVKEAREIIFKSDAIRTFILIVLAAAVLYYFSKSKLEKYILAGTLLVFVLADMWNVNKRYLNNSNYVSKRENQNPFQPSPANLEILKDTDPNFRVYNTTTRPDQDAATSYFHKSLGGYHGAKLKRYDELMSFHLFRGNKQVFNMLNAKYFIQAGENRQLLAVRNPEALGNAWFVNEIRWVPNADSEITALSNFDPAKTAIADRKFKPEAGSFSFRKDSAATIKLTSYKPNDLVYQSNAQSDQLAVFSEIYYPSGWNAYIDGKSSSYFGVNYVLRAMKIPGGKHTIEFKFEPTLYKKGEKISYAASILLFLVVGSLLGMELKNHLSEGKEQKNKNAV